MPRNSRANQNISGACWFFVLPPSVPTNTARHTVGLNVLVLLDVGLLL
jgi:hypothetical protein